MTSIQNNEYRFKFDAYHLQAPFASFLPGIAGPDGTPLWCFYVNRGQGVACFGYSDKNHPILEFKPADQAYRDTGRLGFRTFLRQDGEYWESFADGIDKSTPARRLSVGLSGFHLIEDNGKLRIKVDYATVPGEIYPGLLRHLEIVNITSRSSNLELLDGLPRIIPRGINDAVLKSMSYTAAAWIETNLVNPTLPLFRTRASMEDTVDIHPVKGCHFMAAVARLAGTDRVLQPLVDAEMVFGNNLSYDFPERFQKGGLTEVMASRPVLLGRYPAAFTGLSTTLQPDEKIDLYTIYGYTASPQIAENHQHDWQSSQWFENKFAEYNNRIDECIAPFRMHTAIPDLDAYTAQTALDNTLRGGKPVVWSEGDTARTYYLYSRKHGDMERDYNDFSLLPTRYSTGFGNYRDMNQNRRIDITLQPEMNTAAIRQFMDLIQPDGYNPLIVGGGGFRLNDEASTRILRQFPGLKIPQNGIFTPGDLANANIPPQDFPTILSTTEYVPEACFGEGYWVDHWTYNLDLIDQYLRIYPDRTDELLFDCADYRWYETPGIRIRPLDERFKCVNEKIVAGSHLVEKTHEGRFLEHRSTLMEKLITLALVKCAVLGYEERGLEMEAGRPGWYDALNGLPGHFGSSLSDGAELLRLLRMLLSLAGHRQEQSVTLFSAVWNLLDDLKTITLLPDQHERWLARRRACDRYRTSLTAGGVNKEPEVRKGSLGEVMDFLNTGKSRLDEALTAAAAENDGLLPTYYRFEPTSWIPGTNGYVLPGRMKRSTLPLFLEGVVKQLKIASSLEEKILIHEKVKRSPLYDTKIDMYVLNAPLDDQPASLGRAMAFPGGWLENGSVWLHMEYKYLLELLHIGDGKLFWTEAQQVLIPFLDTGRYGRSPYENSSFIASSRYPVEEFHGRGFIGRLSGATAEYLTMWSEFILGRRPIVIESGKTVFRPAPLLPATLFREDDCLEFMLFSTVHVCYENPDRIDLFEGKYGIKSISITENDTTRQYADCLPTDDLEKLRQGKISSMRVVFFHLKIALKS